MKVRREATAERMPAVPLGERLVALVDMALRLVLILLLSAYCALRERRNDYAPGEIIVRESASLIIATGAGLLRIMEVQPSGKPRMDAAAWWRGARAQESEKLD